MKSLTKYVIFSIIVLISYSIVEFIFSTKYGISHDTLTTCLFGAFGGEIFSCAVIKVFKIKDKNTDENDLEFYDINDEGGEG